jgi:hypothetical protein
MTLVPTSLREEVERRAAGRCEYCRLSQQTQVATFPVDHVLPVTEGGETILGNLALACPRCNAAKWKRVAAEDPVSGATVPLFDPRTQVWGDHFRWSDRDATVLEGLTAVGRATIVGLELNHARHLEVRRWLIVLGTHPPRQEGG